MSTRVFHVDVNELLLLLIPLNMVVKFCAGDQSRWNSAWIAGIYESLFWRAMVSTEFIVF